MVQRLMTTTSAPHDCSYCVQTIISQYIDICASVPAEPPSTFLCVLLDPPLSRGKFLAVLGERAAHLRA